MAKKRCVWCNEKNEKYVCYHDEEWGVLNLSDSYLFEMLLLEAFQAGLSWECVLNKREAFRKAFDNFETALTKEITTLPDRKKVEKQLKKAKRKL